LKNPVSSAARLLNVIVQTTLSLARLPLPGAPAQVPPVAHARGMDLSRWEKWLDHHTLTHREAAAPRLLVDGDQFFPRLQSSMAAATNHIRVEVFIFDNYDLAVQVADQLKQR